MMNIARPIGRLLLASALTSLWAATAHAINVQVQPDAVRLGDTLSIRVTPDSGEQLSQTPTVELSAVNSARQRVGTPTRYQAFQVAPNQWRALIPTTPLDQPGRRWLRVTGNGQQRNLMLWVDNRQFPTQRIWLPKQKKPTNPNFDPQYEFRQADAFKALVTPQKFWQGTFVRPNVGRYSTGFGVRRYYNGVFAKDYYHRGLDYASGTGSPVKAAAAGRVSLVGRESQGFRVHGNVVGIDHGQSVATIYLHLSRIDVKEGEMVQPGQVIGAVGSTGAVTGAHLHFGLYVAGQAVDPAPWLRRGFD